MKDEYLVDEWGLENVVNFINECDKYLREKEKMWIDLRIGENGRFVVENCSDEMLVGSEVCVNINKNWEIEEFMSLLTGEVWLKESFEMDVFDSDDRIERIFLSQK